jgi:thiamine biosynthesis protein ThiI
MRLLLAKCGELALKGLNRNSFEKKLIDDLRRRLRGDAAEISIRQSAIYISPRPGADVYAMRDKALKAFGLASVSVVHRTEKDIGKIKGLALDLLKERLPYESFKVEAKRADKSFPLSSPEICREVGGHLSENVENARVDVRSPDILLNVEIRETGAYL